MAETAEKYFDAGTAEKTKLNSTVRHILDDPTANPIVPSEQLLTRAKIQQFIPKGSNLKVTDRVMEIIANMEKTTGMSQEYMEEQFLTHMNVISKVKSVDLIKYANALKFCTLKRHMKNVQAWAIVFPDRYHKLQEREAIAKANGDKINVNISAHVSNYNSTDLVTSIDAQMIMSAQIQYAPYYHAAVKKHFELMNGIAAPTPDGEAMAVSPKVQLEAASALMTLAAPPEETTTTIDININKGSIVDDYEKAIAMMAEAKLEAINDGKDTLKTINAPIRAKEDIIDVEEVD